MSIPTIEEYPNTTIYLIRLEQYLNNKIIKPQKKLIFDFLNEWTKKKYKSLLEFEKIYYNNLPSNLESKNFLIKNFNFYNDHFKLKFIYEEKLFTTYNVIYFLKHMLNKIGFTIVREKTDKYKRYTIIHRY